MANRRLTSEELQAAQSLLNDVRARLKTLAGDDDHLLWALRRKVAKELGYDERSKPAHRRALKLKKGKAQGGKCSVCHDELPLVGAVLDRLEAMSGYTVANTRLLCPSCDTRIQSERGYR